MPDGRTLSSAGCYSAVEGRRLRDRIEKFGQHQPLNRQAERYAKEGGPLSLSTLADQVGPAAPCWNPGALKPTSAERLHGDDATVPVLAKGKTDTGRCWVYVRDDRPFGGPAPPAAMFYHSRDRAGENPPGASRHLRWDFPADAYSGYNKLYELDRKPGPILEVACWVHARRSFFIMGGRGRDMALVPLLRRF